MTTKLLGEGVPEDRGGGSGAWSREEKCSLGVVRVIHWRLSGGDFTEVYLNGTGAWDFPSIYLLGHVECKTADLLDLYIREFFKLGTPALLVSMLANVSARAREEGEAAAQFRMRVALGFRGDR